MPTNAKNLNQLGQILTKNGTTQIANKCGKNLKPVGTNTHKKCYNSNCQQMQKTVNRLGQILTKNPNHFLQGQCFNLKGRYKTTCKKEKRKFERKLPQNLENLYTYNNKEFGNLLKQIKGNSSNKSPEYQTLPSLNDLDKHYKNLIQKDCTLIKQDFPEPLKTKPTDSLNRKITIQEIKESIKYLKTKKVPGLHNITN